MSALLLALWAAMMAYAAPRALSRLRWPRRSPRAALLLWQATGLSAVLAALLTVPAAVLPRLLTGPDEPRSWDGWLLTGLVVATAATAGILLVLLRTGHRVGTGLRRLRREHRELLDLVAIPPPSGHDASEDWRVLDAPGRTAYCLPGLRHRLVLSRGAVASLHREELRAVIAHERSHIRARHDLVLELFTVLHQSVPRRLRARDGMREVQLLIEALADRAAMAVTGPLPLARALVVMAEPSTGAPGPPVSTEGALGAGRHTRTRLELILESDRPHLVGAATLITAAAVITLSPVLLVWPSV